MGRGVLETPPHGAAASFFPNFNFGAQLPPFWGNLRFLLKAAPSFAPTIEAQTVPPLLPCWCTRLPHTSTYCPCRPFWNFNPLRFWAIKILPKDFFWKFFQLGPDLGAPSAFLVSNIIRDGLEFRHQMSPLYIWCSPSKGQTEEGPLVPAVT